MKKTVTEKMLLKMLQKSLQNQIFKKIVTIPKAEKITAKKNVVFDVVVNVVKPNA